MSRVLRILLIVSLFLPLFPHAALGINCDDPEVVAKSFSSSYDLTFTVNEDGSTLITQKIGIKNLTEECHAEFYKVDIPSLKVRDISGQDADGSLAIEVQKGETLTTLSTKLNKEIIGKDNTAHFSLSYTIDGLAYKEGNIWSLIANKIETKDKIDSYSVKISVPAKFGSVFSLSPKPESTTQSEGRTILIFGKDSLSFKGISARFGNIQQISFKVQAPLENQTFFKKSFSINLPPDTEKQQVLISKMDPHPEKIELDRNGNYVATYEVSPKSLVEVKVEGVVGILGKESFPNPKVVSKEFLEDLKGGGRFVQVQDKLIQEKAKELKTPFDIYNFVTSSFSYDFETLKAGAATRRGANTLLRKKEKATNLDFVDLFVSLVKASGVPAREVYGVALSGDQAKKPTFIAAPLNTADLHVWAQFYDSEKKTWVDVDPTWGATTGEEHFGKELPDRLTIFYTSAGDGLENLKMITAPGSKIESSYITSKVDFSPKIDLGVKTDQAFSGFPVVVVVTIENKSGVSLLSGKLLLAVENLSLIDEKEKVLPQLFPYEKKTFSFKIRSGDLFNTTKGRVKASLEGKNGLNNFNSSKEYEVIVKPFFSLGTQQILLLVLIALLVFGIFTARIKRPKPKSS